MSPLSLVSHGASQNPHHRLLSGPQIGQMPNLVTQEFEQRMLEYLKILQTPKETARKYITVNNRKTFHFSRVFI